jgi:hypothetical protein
MDLDTKWQPNDQTKSLIINLYLHKLICQDIPFLLWQNEWNRVRISQDKHQQPAESTKQAPIH